MANNNYAITVDVHNANNKSVDAYGTGTYLCSTGLTFSPTSGLSSFKVDAITIQGPIATNYTVSANKTLPFVVVNGVTDKILFNVTFANSTPTDSVLGFPVSARVTASTGSLSARVTGTAMAASSGNSSVFTVSGINGWRGEDGGRIWPTHAEHMRMRNLGYF